MAGGGGGAEVISLGTIIAGLAIVVNLGWNLWNTLHTRDVANNIRVEQRQVERWDRLRGRIEANLDAFVSDLKSAHMIVAKAANEPQKQSVLEIVEIEIVHKQDLLAMALEAADRSDCCDAESFSYLVNGRADYNGETSWDMILTVLASAAIAGQNQVQHLKRLNRYANDIDTCVREALERQDNALIPKTRQRWSLITGIKPRREKN